MNVSKKLIVQVQVLRSVLITGSLVITVLLTDEHFKISTLFPILQFTYFMYPKGDKPRLKKTKVCFSEI